jgi:hypothetical protein
MCPEAKLLPSSCSWVGSSSCRLREKRAARAWNSVLEPGSSLAAPRGRSAVAGGEGRDEARHLARPCAASPPPSGVGAPSSSSSSRPPSIAPSAPAGTASSNSLPASSSSALRTSAAPSLWGSSTSAPLRLRRPLRRRWCAHRVGEGGRPPRRVKVRR